MIRLGRGTLFLTPRARLCKNVAMSSFRLRIAATLSTTGPTRGANRERSKPLASVLITSEIDRALCDARGGRERGKKPPVITELVHANNTARALSRNRLSRDRDAIVIKCFTRRRWQREIPAESHTHVRSHTRVRRKTPLNGGPA